MPELNYLPELEFQVRMAMDVPELNSQKLNALREQFITQAMATLKPDLQVATASHSFRPEKETKMKRTTLQISHRLAWGMALIVAVILLTLVFTSPTVVNALRRLLGFIPGVGFVEQDSSLRILDKSITVERENVSLTIEQVVASPDKTVIVYHYFVPQFDESVYQTPMDPNTGNPALVLPDGNKLEIRFGMRMVGDGLPTDKGAPIRYSLEFPPLPTDVMGVTLELPSLPAIPLGAAGPENWQISLKLIPAPEGFVVPVFVVEDIGMDDGSATETIPSPEAPSGNVGALHGITASLDLYIPQDDGYLLIGSMQWSENDYPAYAVKPLDYMKVTDANGGEIPFEPVLGPVPEKPQDEEYRSYWAIKILVKSFTAPLKIRIESASVNINTPIVFQFDPGPNPTPGQGWEINQDFQISDIRARILKATLTTLGSSDLVFQFDIQAQPNELADVFIGMSIGQCMGGGGGSPAEPFESIQVYYNICRTDLPSGPLEAQVSGAQIWGPWQVEWTPPETTSVSPPTPDTSPFTHPDACVTISKFEQALNEKPSLPEGFGGRVILYGPYLGNSSLWKTSIVALDGSGPETLGDGDGNFSSDGSKLAFSRYMDENVELGIFITDFTTGETIQLPGTTRYDFNPIWSPDGTQIVFNRGGPYDLFAVNVDGSNMRRLTYDQGQEFAIGWMPDGQHLLYTLPGLPYQQTNHIVDVQTGIIDYFSNDEILGISPDAKYKIIAERGPVKVDTTRDIEATYFSNLDDSNRWMLAESGILLQYPIWSADGEWLLVSLSKLSDSKNTPIFIHLTDCQIIPLPKLNGIVVDWLP